MIVAVDRDYGIGKDGKLLARLPKDLGFFKGKTLGKVVIMGRKTLESLPGQKPLAERTNIILSRNRKYQVPGALVLHTPDQVLAWLEGEKIPADRVFIAGGAEIYRLFMPYCQRAYITKIDYSFQADRHLERIEDSPQWQEVDRSQIQEENGYRYDWRTYSRLGNKM